MQRRFAQLPGVATRAHHAAIFRKNKGMFAYAAEVQKPQGIERGRSSGDRSDAAFERRLKQTFSGSLEQGLHCFLRYQGTAPVPQPGQPLYDAFRDAAPN